MTAHSILAYAPVYLAVVDGEGVYGTFLTYGLTAAFAGSALICFLYFWSQGRLEMNEEAKWQMMKEEDNHAK